MKNKEWRHKIEGTEYVHKCTKAWTGSFTPDVFHALYSSSESIKGTKLCIVLRTLGTNMILEQFVAYFLCMGHQISGVYQFRSVIVSGRQGVNYNSM